MFLWNTILAIVCVACTNVSTTRHTYEPNIEALKSGRCRVSIPDDGDVSSVKFSANVNTLIRAQNPGTIFAEQNQKINNRCVLTFNCNVRDGDILHYWLSVHSQRKGSLLENKWLITELLDEFTPLYNHGNSRVPTNPNNGNMRGYNSASKIPNNSAYIRGYSRVDTIPNNAENTRGSMIFTDEFDGPTINTTKWVIEHIIPTYSGPDYEFNTYEDRDDVRFIQNGKLYIKPIAFTREDEVRGAIDLTEGCTSKDNSQCYYATTPGFILPPVVSAKIKSKVSFKYGKVEIRAKLPQGDWIYPILQLEPIDKSSNSLNIWIAYSRGNIHLKGSNPGNYGSSLLLGGPTTHSSEPDRSNIAVSLFSNTSYSDEYHVYTLEWMPAKMKLYVDNMLYGDVSTSRFGNGNAFNSEYVLSIGVAVGGVSDFADEFRSGENYKPWVNEDEHRLEHFFDARDTWIQTWKDDKQALEIDYVKVTAV